MAPKCDIPESWPIVICILCFPDCILMILYPPYIVPIVFKKIKRLRVKCRNLLIGLLYIFPSVLLIILIFFFLPSYLSCAYVIHCVQQIKKSVVKCSNVCLHFSVCPPSYPHAFTFPHVILSCVIHFHHIAWIVLHFAFCTAPYPHTLPHHMCCLY